MKFASLLFLFLPLLARAHIGSPNIFFDGQAGPYAVRTVIRPPAVLPGFAQVDVRLSNRSVTNVWLQAGVWEAAKEAAPAPIPAAPVPGDANLFNGAIWLLRPGAYSLRITVEGAEGTASVVVPMNSAATQRPQMTAELRALLLGLGLVLFAGILWLVGAAARDSTLSPGTIPTVCDRRRGILVAIVAALAVVVGILGGAARWRRMDREFRNNAMSKPLPVVATVQTNGSLRLLQLTQEKQGVAGWDTLVADHGKLMHLFLIHGPDFNTFAHLHPVRRNSSSFQNVLPALIAGSYQLYAEVTHENGANETLTATVSLARPTGRPLQISGTNMLNEVFCQSTILSATNSPQPFALDIDDSWHVSPASPTRGSKISGLMNGYTMKFLSEGRLIENRELSLRFALFDAEGHPVVLQPYMGMLGHAVVRRSDGEVFTHLHPMGSISMAAQAMLAQRERSESDAIGGFTLSTNGSRSTLQSPNGGNEVGFPYAFPRPGDYRLWIQVRVNFRVYTGVFDLTVDPA